MSDNHIRNVAIVGAGGHVGTYMTEALLKTGNHVVTAITRAESTSPLPPGIHHVAKVDYSSQASLTAALTGQHALIITLGLAAGPSAQEVLVRAAAQAGVKWILPCEWGYDVENEALVKDIPLPRESGFAATRELIESCGGDGGCAWIGVATGQWYEWSLALSFAFGFDFEERVVTLFDAGEAPMTVSTWPQVGRTVAALLSLPVSAAGGSACLEQFRNKTVYARSFTLTQKEMFESVKRVTGTTDGEWKVVTEASKARYEEGMAQMKAGEMMGFGKLLYARLFFPDGAGNIEGRREMVNGVIGLPEEDLDEATGRAVERARKYKGGFPH